MAGSTGSAISNIATYPLDLIITRLQIQRQFRKNQSQAGEQEYKGLADAASKILEKDGWQGFYTGLLGDTGKTFLDGFLFFLIYDFSRRQRLRRGGQTRSSLPALEELGIGFVAGSLTKLCTTPAANLVTRQQAASFTSASTPSLHEIARQILNEKGPLGFWSGYSASLILTMNPTLTFFLFETFKRLLLPRSKRENPPAVATFILAATAKSCAACVTYPFSLAKARLQAGKSEKEAEDEDQAISEKVHAGPKTKKAARSTIFSTLLTIAKNEGAPGLYEGLHLEVLKSFFSHGITMLVKQLMQKVFARLYYLLTLIVSSRRRQSRASRLAEKAKESGYEYYDLAIKRSSEKIEGLKKVAVEQATLAKEKAREATGYVADYVDDEISEDDDIFGLTGLAQWLENRLKE